MLNGLPERIEPIGLADAGRSFRGELQVDGFSRLGPLLAGPQGKVQVELEFRRGERHIRSLTGKVDGQVNLMCQRCLEPVVFTVNQEFRLAIVGDESEIAHLPEGYEPLLADGEPVPLADVVEDEILLAIPAVPVHQGEQACDSGYRNQADPVRDNPFSVLEKLKN